MPYNQYSNYAYTGDNESVKNRIPNNAFDSSFAEYIAFPNAFDIFVNKDNATQGAFALTESHTLSSLVGNTLYLDHRPDPSSSFSSSDGTLDLGSVNITQSSIDFTTPPTATTFTVSYTAVGDKIWDSHINSMQNAIMSIQQSLGLLSPSGGVGTGIATLPLATQYQPSNQTQLTNLKSTVLPNIVLMSHLEDDFKIGSTSNTNLSSYGSNGYNIEIGNRAGGSAARDNLYIDAAVLSVNESTTSGSSLQYSANTGDVVGFSGTTTFASQVTIGGPNPAAGIYAGTVPGGLTSFYDDAMLRVNGAVYFGDDMSGNGTITFNTVSGVALDVIGTVNADDLIVDNISTFYGLSNFKSRTYVESPGYFETNSDVVLTDKATNIPAKIDSLDPSYADTVIRGNHRINDVVTTPVFDRNFETAHDNPYPSGQKTHPLQGFTMFPMLGGWTFTGTVNFNKASDYSHKNVVLLDSDLRTVTSHDSTYDYGSYAPGMFSPGDTYLEVSNGGSDSFMYPIYWHEPFTGLSPTTLTGVNVYLAGDDLSMSSPGIAGETYRLVQPSNAPMDFLSGNFDSPTAPTAIFGIPSNSYYGNSIQKTIHLKTAPSLVGPSTAGSPEGLAREIRNNDTISCALSQALQRNIDHEKISATVGYGGISPLTGVAYIYAASHSAHSTLSEDVTLIASPSPYGICSNNTWANGLNINPGQFVSIGEVTASTSNGTSWTEVETVGYRANGFYDSCWVPLVQYMNSDAFGIGTTAAPTDLGRCLPLHGSLDGGDDYFNNAGDYNFFVEHNLGPVTSLREVSIRILVGSLDEDFSTRPDGQWESFHQLSVTHGSLFSTPTVPYRSTSDYADNGHLSSLSTNYFRDISAQARVAYYDTRFARITIKDSTVNGEGILDRVGNGAQYIRVIIERTR